MTNFAGATLDAGLELSGTLVVLSSLAGTAQDSVEISGTLAVSLPLSGTVEDEAQLAGTLTNNLAASVDAALELTGTFALGAPLAGSVDDEVTLSALLAVPLAGTLDDELALTGEIGLVSFAGTLEDDVTLVGQLSPPPLAFGWVWNTSYSCYVYDAGPYLGPGSVLPQVSVPAGASELGYLVTSDIVGGGGDLRTTQLFIDPYAYGSITAFNLARGDGAAAVLDPHLYLIWKPSVGNSEATSPPPGVAPQPFYPASYATGGTDTDGVAPLPAALNTTISTAQYFGNLTPSAPATLFEGNANLNTAGVLWYWLRVSPDFGIPSRANGGLTVNGLSYVALSVATTTVWQLPNTLTDPAAFQAYIDANPAVASGGFPLTAPTAEGERFYLVRLTGTGTGELQVTGPGLQVGDTLAFAQSFYYTVPASRTGFNAGGAPGYEAGFYLNTPPVNQGAQYALGRRTYTFNGNNGAITNTVGDPVDRISAPITQYLQAQAGDGSYSTIEEWSTVMFDAPELEFWWNLYFNTPSDFHPDPFVGLWAEPTPQPTEDPSLTYSSVEVQWDDSTFALMDEVYVLYTEDRSDNAYNPSWTEPRVQVGIGLGNLTIPDAGQVEPGAPTPAQYALAHPSATPSGSALRANYQEYFLVDRAAYNETTYWVGFTRRAPEKIPDYDPSLIIGQSMIWWGQVALSVSMIVRGPRYRYRVPYIVAATELLARLRHSGIVGPVRVTDQRVVPAAGPKGTPRIGTSGESLLSVGGSGQHKPQIPLRTASVPAGP